MRKVTSLTALVSFLLLLLNSIVLYIVPHGRIAYWADWRLWGLTKTEWANQHVIIGVLFLLAIFIHTFYNWTPIVAYLKNRARKLRIFTREFNIALLLVVICTVGTYVEIVPFSWVLTFSESIKNTAAQNYGEPPYGRAELSSLKTFTSKMGIDLTESLTRLQKAGIQVDDDKQTLLNIAQLNNTSPQQLFLKMKPEEKPEEKAGLTNAFPDAPPAGFGKRPLADICQEYGMNISATMSKLAEENIKATPNGNIKQIAEENNLTTAEIFTALRKAAEKDS